MRNGVERIRKIFIYYYRSMADDDFSYGESSDEDELLDLVEEEEDFAFESEDEEDFVQKKPSKAKTRSVSPVKKAAPKKPAPKKPAKKKAEPEDFSPEEDDFEDELAVEAEPEEDDFAPPAKKTGKRKSSPVKKAPPAKKAKTVKTKTTKEPVKLQSAVPARSSALSSRKPLDAAGVKISSGGPVRRRYGLSKLSSATPLHPR